MAMEELGVQLAGLIVAVLVAAWRVQAHIDNRLKDFVSRAEFVKDIERLYDQLERIDKKLDRVIHN